MYKLKMECTYRVANNFYEFYLLKWRLKSRIRLHVKTLPDPFILYMDHDFLINSKSLLKILFSMVKNSLLEYHIDSGKFIIYSNNRKNKLRFAKDVSAIETIEKAINLCDSVRDYDKDFLLIQIGGADFFVRKNMTSDIYVVKEAFLFEQYSFIYPFLKDAVVADIGANIGDTAVLFCKKGAKKVYAYEPHPFFFNLALKNIELNGMSDKVVVKQCGIGAEEGTITVKDDNMMGPTGSFGSKKITKAGENKIEIIKFSKILEDAGNIDVLKMDCEGAEFEALFSCQPQLLKKIRVIAMEYHDNPETIIDHLGRIGFNVEIKRDTVGRYSRHGLLFAESKL